MAACRRHAPRHGEGRVDRYMGLAVRGNVALRYASGVLGGAWDGGGDPWAWMFEQARLARPPECSDLVPYWLFDDVPDGQAMKVERRVPIVPLSKEASRYQALKRSLVYYRLAFGQPRQDDLVHWLQQVLGDLTVSRCLCSGGYGWAGRALLTCLALRLGNGYYVVN